MNVSKEQAVKLFVALGYNTAGNWTGEKLYKKINNLPNIVEEDYDLKSDTLNDLVHEILHSTDAVCITEETASETPEIQEESEETMKTKKSEKKTKTPKEPKVKKEKKAKVEVELDVFGNRKDSILSKVNQALSTTPKTMKELQEAVGTDKTFYEHLKKLVEKGLIVKDGKTFHLK